jgi:hypothetical protein
MANAASTPHPCGKHRYQTVAEGMAMAQAFLRSGLNISDFARQQGVSFRMVKYWSGRARQLATASEVASASPPLLEHVAAVDAHGGITITEDSPKRQRTVPDTACIEVHLRRGLRISVTPGFSPALLRQIVSCLEGDSPC